MPYRQGRRRKRRTQSNADSLEDKNAPKSFVFRQGKVPNSVQSLVENIRCIFEPYTAINLVESSKNKLKDYEGIAGPLGVSHFVTLSQSELGTNVRFMRFPRGPTLTFRADEYALIKDIAAMQRKPQSPNGPEYRHSPLVVLNGFSSSGKENIKQIMAAMFQNMFPPLDVSSMNLKQCRRVLLFNLTPVSELEDKDDLIVEVRHYIINAAPTGISKSLRKVVKGKVPSRLSKLEDISDYVCNQDSGYYSSDSEAEDLPEHKVRLPQDYVGRGNMASGKSAIRLKELGPRVTLKLLKIENGFHDGEVLYNRFVVKTAAEKLEQKREYELKQTQKKERRLQQEENVKRKMLNNDKEQ